MAQMMPYAGARAGGRPTAPVNQGRVALIGRVAWEEFQEREQVQNREECDETNFFPCGKLMNEDLLHVRMSEPFVARRLMFQSGGGPANMLPGFTSVNGLFIPKLAVNRLREAGEMGSDEDLIEQVFWAMFYVAGIAGVNSDYLPLADRTTTEAGYDTKGIRDFLNLTKRRLCVGDRLRGRLPTKHESETRPNVEGRDRRKETIVIDRVDPFKTRADKEHVVRQLGLDTIDGLKDAYYSPATGLGAALDQMRPGGSGSGSGSGHGFSGAAQRDRFSEAARDWTALGQLQGIRVFIEILKQQAAAAAPGGTGAAAVAALETLVNTVDLEKLVGLAPVQLANDDDRIKYTLRQPAIVALGKAGKWKEMDKILAHRAALSLAMGVSKGELYSKSSNIRSQGLQKDGCVHTFARANEAASRYREQELGICVKACDPMNYGDLIIQSGGRL